MKLKQLTTLLSFLAVLPGATSNSLPSETKRATANVPSIETTTPLEDLLEDSSFALQYGIGYYDITTNKKEVNFITLLEYSYAPNNFADFGLYVYFHNGSTKYDIDTYSPLNKITMSLFGGTYTKYPLSFVSKEANEEFYKYKINLSNVSFNNVFSSQPREYCISEIEIHNKKDKNATSTAVGTDFVYTGYASGVKDLEGNVINEVSTLSVSKRESLVVSLETYGSYFRTGQTADIFTQNDIFYVIFGIPNNVLNRFGSLHSIHAEYEFNDIQNKFIVVNQDCEYYPLFAQGLTQTMCNHDHFLTGPVPIYFRYDSTEFQNQYLHRDNSGFRNIVVPVSDYTKPIPSKDMVPYFEQYYIPSARTNINKNWQVNQLFSSINSFSDQLGIWAKFVSWWRGVKLEEFESITNMPVIEPMPSSSFLLNPNSFYTLEEEKASIASFLLSLEIQNASPYIFRFDVGEYQSYRLFEYHATPSSIDLALPAYLAKMDYIRDFDIIDLSFVNELEEITVIPVAMSPINIIPGLTPPPQRESDWWLIILILLIVLIVLIILICAFMQYNPFIAIINGIRKATKRRKSKKY